MQCILEAIKVKHIETNAVKWKKKQGIVFVCEEENCSTLPACVKATDHLDKAIDKQVRHDLGGQYIVSQNFACLYIKWLGLGLA